MKRRTSTNHLPGLDTSLCDPRPELRLNGHARPPVRPFGQLPHRPAARLIRKEVEFARAGLQEMNHLVEEAMRMDQRLDELQPRFEVAAMQKAWFVMISYFIGTIVFLFSIFWGGWIVVFVRVGIAGFLVGLYFVPVHYFVTGSLREDARLVRELDKKSLAYARKAAKMGQATTRALRLNG